MMTRAVSVDETTSVMVGVVGHRSEDVFRIKHLVELYSHSTKIVLVWNGPDKCISECDWLRDVLYIHNNKNIGAASARNQIAKIFLSTSLKYLFFIDADVLVSRGLVEYIVSIHQHVNKPAFISCVVTFDNSDEVFTAGMSILDHGMEVLHHPPLKGVFDEVDAVSTSIVMIDRFALENIGLMNERYFVYWEDVEWCLRAKGRGFKNYILNKALASHPNISRNADMVAIFLLNRNYFTLLREYYGVYVAVSMLRKRICLLDFKKVLYDERWVARCFAVCLGLMSGLMHISGRPRLAVVLNGIAKCEASTKKALYPYYRRLVDRNTK